MNNDFWDKLNPPGQPSWDIIMIYKRLLKEKRTVKSVEEVQPGAYKITIKRVWLTARTDDIYYVAEDGHHIMNTGEVTNKRFTLNMLQM